MISFELRSRFNVQPQDAMKIHKMPWQPTRCHDHPQDVMSSQRKPCPLIILFCHKMPCPDKGSHVHWLFCLVTRCQVQPKDAVFSRRMPCQSVSNKHCPVLVFRCWCSSYLVVCIPGGVHTWWCAYLVVGWCILGCVHTLWRTYLLLCIAGVAHTWWSVMWIIVIMFAHLMLFVGTKQGEVNEAWRRDPRYRITSEWGSEK